LADFHDQRRHFLENHQKIVHWSNSSGGVCKLRAEGPLIGAFYLIDPSGRSSSFAYGRRDFNYKQFVISLCRSLMTKTFSSPIRRSLFCRSLGQGKLWGGRSHVTRPTNGKIPLKKIVQKIEKNQEN